MGSRASTTGADVKTCTRCKVEKPLKDFYAYRNGSPRARCKRCTIEVHRAYALKNPEVVAQGQRNRAPQRSRRSRLRGEAARWARVLIYDPCAYCGAPAEHIDHIMPKAKGGPAQDPGNLTAACEPCNESKGARSLLTFLLVRA